MYVSMKLDEYRIHNLDFFPLFIDVGSLAKSPTLEFAIHIR